MSVYNVVPRSKLTLLKIIFALFVLAFLFVFIGNAVAQAGGTAEAIPVHDASLAPDGSAVPSGVTQFITGLASAHPWVVLVFSLMGLLRAILKPAFAWYHSYVESTPDKSDDARLEKIEHSPVLKWVFFGLDYVGSIKLKK